mmetsp:Transcript_17280/g.47865  ORF Transcript_17280/g.47865 Transcript_17280/m.47865 type:complete len:88 (+) Transcript_17280:1448-1711(+)
MIYASVAVLQCWRADYLSTVPCKAHQTPMDQTLSRTVGSDMKKESSLLNHGIRRKEARDFDCYFSGGIICSHSHGAVGTGMHVSMYS